MSNQSIVMKMGWRSARFDSSKKDIRYSLPEKTYENYDKTITVEDVKVLRGIGKKSINDFTQEDIEKSQKWAYKFWEQLREKSPFFRAWFGDWRAYDKATKRKYIALNTAKIDATEVSRKSSKNIDTGWEIQVNRNGIDETANKRGKWSQEYHSLRNIQEMLINAVLLDTVVVDNPSKRLGNETAFLHNMYCPVSINGEKGMAKLYVTEEVGNKNKFYLVKIEMVPTESTVLGTSADTPNSSVDTNISVADIFNFVKINNDRFEADSDNPTYFEPKPVDKHMVNEDGTPRLFYHGTSAEFSSINTNTEYGLPFFVTTDKKSASTFGSHILSVYGRTENPLVLDAQGKAIHSAEYRYRGKSIRISELLRKAKSDGYDCVIVRNTLDSADGTGDTSDVCAFFYPEKQMAEFKAIAEKAGGIVKLYEIKEIIEE